MVWDEQDRGIQRQSALHKLHFGGAFDIACQQQGMLSRTDPQHTGTVVSLPRSISRVQEFKHHLIPDPVLTLPTGCVRLTADFIEHIQLGKYGLASTTMIQVGMALYIQVDLAHALGA